APEAAPPAPLSPVAAALGGAEWDDRSATGLLDGVGGPAVIGVAGPGAGQEDGAALPAEPGEDDAVPEPAVGPPSARLEDASGPAEGIWQEGAARSEGIPTPASPQGTPRDRDALEEAAMGEWRRVIELEPDSMPARAGLLRLSEGRGRAEERLEVLAEVQ